MAGRDDDTRIHIPPISLNVVNDDDLLELSKFIMLEALEDGHKAYEEVMNFFSTEESTAYKVIGRIENVLGRETPDEIKNLISTIANSAYREDLAAYVRTRVVYAINFDDENEMIWIRPTKEACMLYLQSVGEREVESEKEFYEPLAKVFKSYSDDERLPEHVRRKYDTVGYYLENPDKTDEAPYWVLEEFFK